MRRKSWMAPKVLRLNFWPGIPKERVNLVEEYGDFIGSIDEACWPEVRWTQPPRSVTFPLSDLAIPVNRCSLPPLSRILIIRTVRHEGTSSPCRLIPLQTRPRWPFFEDQFPSDTQGGYCYGSEHTRYLFEKKERDNNCLRELAVNNNR